MLRSRDRLLQILSNIVIATRYCARQLIHCTRQSLFLLLSLVIAGLGKPALYRALHTSTNQVIPNANYSDDTTGPSLFVSSLRCVNPVNRRLVDNANLMGGALYIVIMGFRIS